MKFFITALFILDAGANVAACAADRQRLRRFTKVLLMPLLLAVYTLSCRSFSLLIAAALILGWGGDIAMIFKSRKRALCAGMALFGAGHILYIAAMSRMLPAAPAPAAAAAVWASAAAVGAASYLFLRGNIPSELRLPSACYSLLLCALSAQAVVALIQGAPGSLKLTAGALCFLISDSTLSVETFRLGDEPRTDAAVMLTYIAAQALLISGFCA